MGLASDLARSASFNTPRFEPDLRRPSAPAPRADASAIPDSAALRTQRPWRRGDTPEPTVIRRPRAAPRLGGDGQDHADAPRAADGWTEGSAFRREDDELGRLADTTPRERRGRLRLVRPDAIAPEPEPVVEAPKVRRRRDVNYSPVRIVELQEADLEEIERAEELATPVVPAPVVAPAPAAPVAPVSSPRELAPPAYAEPAVAPAPRASLPPEPEVLVRPTRPAPARGPRPSPQVPLPLASPSVAAEPVRAVAPPPVAAAHDAVSLGWLVQIEGREAPLFILAPDILAATQRAAREVGAEQLGRASIRSLGPDISLM